MTTEVADQLADELHTRLVGPLLSLAGTDLRTILAPRVDDAADRIALQLGDEAEQQRTAADVMFALWGTTNPDDDWWRTPLGRACARALAAGTGDVITQQRAADMLGITRGSIAQMVTRGTLARHADGGVLLSSVLERLGR